MPYSRNIHRYEPPPIYKKVMQTLLEINNRMDTIQTDLKLIKKIVSIEKDFVLVNDENHMELDMPVR